MSHAPPTLGAYYYCELGESAHDSDSTPTPAVSNSLSALLFLLLTLSSLYFRIQPHPRHAGRSSQSAAAALSCRPTVIIYIYIYCNIYIYTYHLTSPWPPFVSLRPCFSADLVLLLPLHPCVSAVLRPLASPSQPPFPLCDCLSNTMFAFILSIGM